jgi:hypothetical protein
LRRKAPLSPRPPTRSKHTPSKPRRLPSPDREFWQTQRAALYGRAGGRCERCGTNLNKTGLEAHHRKLRSQGGGHGMENLLALCPECHGWCHGNPAGARMSGWIVTSAGNPAHRGVVLHDGRTVRLSEDGTYDICWDDSEEETA